MTPQPPTADSPQNEIATGTIPSGAITVDPSRMAAPPAPTGFARISAEHLLALPDSERRSNWIQALVDAEVARQCYAQDRALARDFAICGKFDDIRGSTPEQAIATAMVKIQLGRSWGFTPANSMRYIYFVNGKPAVENEIVAEKLQEAGIAWDIEWAYAQAEHKGAKVQRCAGCRLWLKQRRGDTYEPMLDRAGEQISVAFTEADADIAKLSTKQGPWQTFPGDMYYWRCISRVKKYYAPGVLRGAYAMQEVADMQASYEAMPREIEAPAPAPERPRLRDTVLSHQGFDQRSDADDFAEPAADAPFALEGDASKPKPKK
jgi:hypothetical protein